MLNGLEWAATQLFAAGVLDLRIVTAKPEPGDIDGFWIWEPTARIQDIPPILLDFSLVPDPAGREPKFPMWFAHGIELLIHPQHGGITGYDLPFFFSHSRDGIERGYVRVARA